MTYRKFWLTNAKNEIWKFTDQTVKSFLCNPAGLGFNKSMDLVRFGEKLKVDSQSYYLPEPSGEIIFCDKENADRYSQYNSFVQFLIDEPLVLHYELPLSTPAEYTLDCQIAKLTKTETSTKKTMVCSIEFQGLSFWKGTEVTTTGTASSYTLTNNGHIPCGFEITIEGTNMVNPYITLTQDGEMYGEAKFVDSTGFNSVYVDSNDGEQNVILEQGGSVLPNPLSYQDLSISNGAIYVTFVKLARGTSTLAIGMDSGSITGVSIAFTPLYRSV